MKKFLALMLALVMVLSLAACGGNTNTETTEPVTDGGEEVAEVAMKVAMITDYGDITDQSFNQTTYEAAKAWSEANGVEFNYFKPASDSDDDRVAMIEKAIDEGFNVIVMPGYAFAAAIAKTAPEYSDVTFVALDVSEYDLTTAGLATLPANLYSAVYQEELAGYMAGYAAVKLGYTKLGFLGGMAVPAVQRYGYGFVQGADAAAAADGKTDVAIKYAYGNQFYGDADITAAMDTWYADGVEVVFACGGGIFTSAGEAAAKVEGAKVIGEDVDQAATIDGLYGEGMTVTSAMKGLAATVNTLLTQVKDGSFQGGRVENLGLVSADVEANYVQLPVASTQWNDTFAQADYEALVASMFAGDITVDNDITKAAGDFATVVALEDLGNIK